MPGWEQLGMQAAGQVTGGALGLILGNINDRRQLRQQEKLQQLQIRGSKELTDYNSLKQMEMWRNTSYPAQMEMLKKAGLNPALIYGSSGPGGMTNLATGNVASGSAPTGGGEIQSMMGMGLMSAMQAAQIENIKANTEKTKAETQGIQPTILKTQAETASITQGIENQKAQEALLEAQRYATNIAADINARSSNSQVAYWAKRVERETEAVRQDLRENNINDQLIQEKIAYLKAEYAGAALKNILTQHQTGLTDAQIYETITKAQTYIVERMLHADEVTIKSGQHELDRKQFLEDLSDFPKELTGIVSSILGGVIGGGVSKALQPSRNPIGFKQ